ncbi:unnamed protein product, partial [Lampetra fluviatilis]
MSGPPVRGILKRRDVPSASAATAAPSQQQQLGQQQLGQLEGQQLGQQLEQGRRREDDEEVEGEER